jgi:hypothetical protein
VKTLPEKWVLFGSLVTVIVFDLLVDLAKDNPSGLVQPLK